MKIKIEMAKMVEYEVMVNNLELSAAIRKVKEDYSKNKKMEGLNEN